MIDIKPVIKEWCNDDALTGPKEAGEWKLGVIDHSILISS